MAAITVPSVDGDDLYLYMHGIIEEEFPKALRQAFKTLWDQKYALTYGPLDGSCWFRLFQARENTPSLLVVSSDFQLPSNPVPSKSFEELNFDELCNIITNLKCRGLPNYTQQKRLFGKRKSGKPKMSKEDERLFETAIDQLKFVKAQHVKMKGSLNPPLLKRQLSHARRAFTSLGVILNDSRNAIDFSAAGLQELILGKYMYYSDCYSACMNVNFYNIAKVKRAL